MRGRPLPITILVSRWFCLLALALLAVSSTEAAATGGNPAVSLLLSRTDVGTSYSLTRGMTHRWTLAERSDGLPQTVKREFAVRWLAGAQTGFTGSVAVSHQAIVSTADVFRTSEVSRITESWQSRFLRYGRGARLGIPSNAPAGASRFLMRGRMLSHGTKLEVILFLWRHDRAVLSVWIIAKPGIPDLSRLMTLARREDAKVTP